MFLFKLFRQKTRRTTTATAAVFALTLGSVISFGAAAHADYVPLVDFDPEAEEQPGGWYVSGGFQSEYPEELTHTQCSIIFPEAGGILGHIFSPEEMPTGIEEVTAFLESFYINVPAGSGSLVVLIDRILDGGMGTADMMMEIPVGVTGFSPETVVELDDEPSLGLSGQTTLKDVLDALEAEDAEIILFDFWFAPDGAAEVQWIAFGSETYWFGTDSEWFLNNPTCSEESPVVEDQQPKPAAPTPPKKIDTAR